MREVLLAFLFIPLLGTAAVSQKCVEKAKEIGPVLSSETRDLYERKLKEALGHHSRDNNADSFIWVGRRIAYLGSYKEAIEWFSLGISKSNAAGEYNPKLYRHRGHRLITIRCFEEAIADFEKAVSLIKGRPDEIEPDGLPNAKNIPTSTLQSNIWYHLGLAYYLKGDFKNALRAYRECEKVSKNNDMRVATAYWHYMTLRRLGKESAAKRILELFAGEIELIENTDYLKLIKLNRGELKADDLLASISGDANTLGSASLGYGIGNYFLYNGNTEKAKAVFQKIVGGDQWSSFGYIAAEVELARLPGKSG